ncbi:MULTISPECIES: GNAT family N-acetyltransferase [Enterococcus]|uniref:GNAT family N-acetyltransferase n=1 Tax=Candidatus Enterococcus murrayae TaxID=2815321 RepID=A0ABS3HE38_9ENTE|nr:GNAT family N-acetyltransferase [Enterococcus sp. MJM16]MBO0451478.1 GNAT family N-acetyltransferase [Enterococcus sp. MJM16]
MSLNDAVVYRNPVVEDAEEIVAFYNRVGGETTYLSFTENEYPLDVDMQKASIISTEQQPNSVMFLAVADNQIVGIGTITSSHKVKARHCGELGIVVTEKFQGQGIGSELIRRLLDWSKTNGITTKIQLDTRKDNSMAVELYKKFGFQIEGELKNTTLIDGQYYHLYVMGLMI